MKKNMIKHVLILTLSITIGIILGNYFDENYFFESIRRIHIFDDYYIHGSFSLGFLIGFILTALTIYFFLFTKIISIFSRIFYSPFIKLPKGVFRLILVCGFIIPLLFGIISEINVRWSDGKYIFLSLLFGIPIYWILVRIGLWVYAGFQEKK